MWLSAECRVAWAPNAYHCTVLDLTPVYNNIDGHIIPTKYPKAGIWLDTCTGCEFTDPTDEDETLRAQIICTCVRMNGNTVRAWRDLSKFSRPPFEICQRGSLNADGVPSGAEKDIFAYNGWLASWSWQSEECDAGGPSSKMSGLIDIPVISGNESKVALAEAEA